MTILLRTREGTVRVEVVVGCPEEIRPMVFCKLPKGHDGPHSFGPVVDRMLASGRELPGVRP